MNKRKIVIHFSVLQHRFLDSLKKLLTSDNIPVTSLTKVNLIALALEMDSKE